MILFKGNTKQIPLNIKVPVFLIIIWIVMLPGIVSHTLLYNFGIPFVRFQKFYFIVIPLFFAVFQIMKQKKLIVPHFIIFLIVLLSFWFIEFIHSEYNDNMQLEFIHSWMWIYLFFLIITNLSNATKNITFAIEYYIIAVLIYTIILNLAAVGLIKFPIIYSPHTDRLLGIFNLNQFADSNAFAISVVIFCLLSPIFKDQIKKNNAILIMIMLSSLPILTATRGSIVIIVTVITFYLLFTYLKKSILEKIIISTIITLLLIISSQIIVDILYKTVVAQRFVEIDFYSQGRAKQVIASWYNFSNNPLFGVGYKNAAAGIFPGITRSNFQYTQLLASSGILFFVLFVIFIFKIFKSKISLLKHPEIIILVLTIIIQLMFRRPIWSYAFLLFLAYYYGQLTKNQFS